MTTPTSSSTPGFDPLGRQALAKHMPRSWGWLLALGILMVVLGFVGLGMLVTLTVLQTLMFGILMLIGGGAQLVEAWREKGWGAFALHILIALLYIATGVMMIANPVLASITLTLFLAAFFVAVGILRIVMALQVRPLKGWGLTALSGVVSVLLGGLIFYQWPASGLWVLGLFFAIELLSQGIACIALALAAKTA